MDDSYIFFDKSFRDNLLKKIGRPEEKLEFSKILDNIRLSFEKAKPVFSGFLDPIKTTKFMRTLDNAGFGYIAAYGGYDDSERKMIGVSPFDAQMNFPISVIDIICSGYGKSLTHRDFLGAMMGLGVSRFNIGDIVISSDGAKALVSDKIAGYIADNLVKTANVGVKAVVKDAKDVFFPLVARAEKTIFAPSPRLDAIISAAFGLSRSSSRDKKRVSKTLVNWLPADDLSKTANENDIITVRGLGRAEVKKITRKKDGYAVTVIVY
ncbi:MAG: hypothetical protein LBL35_04020 [Clostridiales bacterium]|jgi:RNA-binding protein YlmH|nr:hypothetical protein [Clostridiales bacterium]